MTLLASQQLLEELAGEVELEELGREEIERIAQRAAERAEQLTPPQFKKMLRKLRSGIKKAIAARHRRLIVISGSDHVKLGLLAAQVILHYERVFRKAQKGKEISLLYMFHDEFKDAKLRKEVFKRTVKGRTSIVDLTVARYEESDRYLGTTFQALVMDLWNDLKPNDVGRLVGIVEGGGVIVFVVPPWEKWDTWMTIFKSNLVVPGYREPRHIFISWFKRKLLEHPGIYIYDADRDEVIKAEDYEAREYVRRKPEPPKDAKFPKELYKLALTQDQVKAIHALEWLLEEPRRGHKKAVVLTADRGRGKSCAVGIGVVGLAHLLRKKLKRKIRVIVTAPNLTSVQSFFMLAEKAAEALGYRVYKVKRGPNVLELHTKKFSIEYWEPIDVPDLKADIVAVDEAAGMHVPLLHKIWRAHDRLIFATTIHGYEGAGRGFSVRFLGALRKDKRTELLEVKMHEPIRYAPDDPIERWLFDALLLDAEPADLDEDDIKAIEEGNLRYLRLDPEWLFSREGEKTLRQLFGIYVMAHYRNEPDDLAILADAPHHIIRAMATPSGKIVCAVQIANEGGLDDETIEALLRGEKTPGNIIPDRLLKHLRIWEFGRMRGWRIVRIATHPDVQGRGIGSRMLQEIRDEAEERGLDWVGSGFGVNEQLLNFWLKNGYIPVHMSPDRNPVSGEYTILVLNPIHPLAEELTKLANQEFRRKVIESLHDPYSDLETEVALQILKSGREPVFTDYMPALTPIQVDRLWIYAYGPMTYEAVCDIMTEIARAYWYMYPKTRGFNLSKREEHIIVSKVLQGKSWEEVAEELRTKPHSIMVALKDIARKLLKHFYGIDRESPVGLDGRKVARMPREYKFLLEQPEAGLFGRKFPVKQRGEEREEGGAAPSNPSTREGEVRESS